MKRLSLSIAVRSGITKRQRVLDFTAARGWVRIGEAEWRELRTALPDVSVSVIQQAGMPIDAPWCGVRQHTFEELEESLREFGRVYEMRPELRGECREAVITAKDRARWLSGRRATDEETRARKAEMVEWMLVWLGDPGLFPVWVEALRTAQAKTPTLQPGILRPPTP